MDAEEYKEHLRQAMARGFAHEEQLRERIVRLFNLSPDFSSKTWRGLMAFLKERPPEESLEQFARWWYLTDWRGKQGQPPTPAQIRELWPQAFAKRAYDADSGLKSNPDGSIN